MPFEMRLWEASGNELKTLPRSPLNQEQRLEDWIARDPGILGMELAVIGRQVPTDHGGRIDLLAIDRDACCVIIELKRAKTPREVVAAPGLRQLGSGSRIRGAERDRQVLQESAGVDDLRSSLRSPHA
jgi:hypothetical protein